MPLRVRVALCFIALVAAACGSTEQKPPTPGEVKDFAAVCEKSNEGKRVAVVGYLRLPEEVNRRVGPVLRMYPSTDYSGQPVGVSTNFGNGPNQVGMLSKEFTDKDLKVNTGDGQVAGFGTKVKVSGDLYYPVVGQNFKCALSNPLVEMAN